MTDHERNAVSVVQTMSSLGHKPNEVKTYKVGTTVVYLGNPRTFPLREYAEIKCYEDVIILFMWGYGKDEHLERRYIDASYPQAEAVKDALRHVGMMVE